MKINIGVIFGGRSIEHEVSIISALQAIENIDEDKYNVVAIYLTKDSKFYVGKNIKNIKKYKDISSLLKESDRVLLTSNNHQVEIINYQTKLFNNKYPLLDVVLPIVHGTNVEDGGLQGYLKTLNVPFVGSDILASSIGMDKHIFKILLKDINIPVLDSLVFNNFTYIEEKEKVLKEIEKKFKYPVIIKPVNLGSSIEIKKAKNKDELIDAIEHALLFTNKFLIEEAIENLKEVNCSVLGDYYLQEVSELEEPIGKDEILSYEDKYTSSSKSRGMASLARLIPADISNETADKIKDYAIKTFNALDCAGVVRIDFLINKDTNDIFVNEINTIPGSLSFYLWTPKGLTYSNMLDKIIMLAIKRHKEDNEHTYKFDTNILENFKGGLKGSKS